MATWLPSGVLQACGFFPCNIVFLSLLPSDTNVEACVAACVVVCVASVAQLNRTIARANTSPWSHWVVPDLTFGPGLRCRLNNQGSMVLTDRVHPPLLDIESRSMALRIMDGCFLKCTQIRKRERPDVVAIFCYGKKNTVSGTPACSDHIT